MKNQGKPVNRTIIGLVLIVVAIIAAVLIIPSLQKKTENKISVLRVKESIGVGDIFSGDNLEIIEVSESSVPEGAVKSLSSVEGKASNAVLLKGDFVLEGKISGKATKEDTINNIPEGYVITSFSIDSFVGSVSGTIEEGDIISVVSKKTISVKNYETGENDEFLVTYIPDELRYVKVLGMTLADGREVTGAVTNDDGSKTIPQTITVLATERQAERLLLIDSYDLSFFLVSRGNEERAEELLKLQSEVLEKIAESGSNLSPSEKISGETELSALGIYDLSASERQILLEIFFGENIENGIIPGKYFEDGKVRVIGDGEVTGNIFEEAVIFKDDEGAYHVLSVTAFNEKYIMYKENSEEKVITKEEYEKLTNEEKRKIDETRIEK